jgi:phospholipid N-methyltransferase
MAEMRYGAECRAFFREFREQYRNTGSILPSSRALARALAAEIRKVPGPRRILEVGPGTGPVTAEILRRLRPGDQFDIVEINERFVAVLRERFATEPLFRRRRSQVHLIHGPLQEVPGEGVYDFLVSGLPLNNFPVALVRDIFRAYQRLLRPAGVLSYFEYAWIRPMKLPFVKSRERHRLLCIGRLVDRKIRAYQFREDLVCWNVPPAVARHLRFTRPGRANPNSM